MSKLEEILGYNRKFIENKDYEAYITTKIPKKKMVILSCMDTRLTELLPKAMNIKNGDAKIIKDAGATVMHHFGGVMRSIVVAVYEFGAEDVFVVGHHGCGMSNLDTKSLVKKMVDRGIKEETISTLNNAGVNVEKWLHGFESVEESIKESVRMIKDHPLIPSDIKVHGLIMSPETGELEVIVDGNA
ncbi:carbonic anhydrase [Clostridium saccharoperbutylacetonicum]|uniref:carbonic anhydrase n=1 Tax=Clostridium saccharoperbutylacetonicum N1-4(HMT) TaxID=931276 RepID=M1MKF1_9CLOT|nr:carbonic anhydrase [Clostridium saccharoperbutylacetonicum]AGF58414.1 carbonic anhydrase [Clostridium saccharoperbutylacetonicum N1-4(HMT)]NRT60808.1 carbonic anhydrase [Clostridium saccharoperbutylacetonicum]NSB24122.1 carbonic anhydrase [Clostridium saccharoperbutylacetonicum]NSB43500.1 carbonic anhydrase [Clostridium saccharoperbutylacetonicum]